MTIQANFPAIRPTLLLDFANTEALDPRITFSRPTTGTYYDAKTSAVAEQNLATYSEQFDNAIWTKENSTVTANSTTAPDGQTTADTLTNNATNGEHRVYQTILPLGTGKTFSFYAKAATATFIGVTGTGNSAETAIFNLSTGAVAAVTNGTATITSAGNSWYRCTYTATSASATTYIILNFGTTQAQATAGTAYVGAGEYLYVWGAQVEIRSSATAYTATTTTTITNYIPVLQTAVANAARFDHNPTTRESLGLLIEEQRTNLFTYSDDFSNANWVKTAATVTSNTIIAPDGTLTGDKLVESATTAAHSIYELVGVSATSYTFSAYVKAGERTFVAFEFSFNAGGYAWFNLTTGAIGTVGGFITASNCTINAVGNGWYKCSITQTLTAGTVQPRIYPASADNVVNYAGNGFSGIYIWGAQLEAGAFATSYIPTVASQVTRSADSASMTGTNFSSWYNISQGTVYTEASYKGGNSVNQLWSIDDGTTNNRLTAQMYNTNAFASVASGTVQALLTVSGTPTVNTYYKTASSFATDNFLFTANGATPLTDTSGSMPTNLTTLNIGKTFNTASYLNGTLKKLAYYPTTSTSAQLQGLTG